MSDKDMGMTNKQFQAFSSKALKASNPDQGFVLSNLQKYERHYKREGLIQDYVQNAQRLADIFEKKGKIDFAGIIYSALMKFKTLPFDIRENLIKRGIEIAQMQKDAIHELGRVVDLKILYHENIETRRKDYIKTLLSEEKLLKRIVREYEICADGFKTVSKEMKPKDHYVCKLGLVKVDIAKQFINTNKKVALEKLKEAKKIFNNLKKYKEEFFAQGLIEQIKH